MGDEFALDGSAYQRFKAAVVAAAPREGFTVTAEQVERWAAEHEARRAADTPPKLRDEDFPDQPGEDSSGGPVG